MSLFAPVTSYFVKLVRMRLVDKLDALYELCVSEVVKELDGLVLGATDVRFWYELAVADDALL